MKVLGKSMATLAFVLAILLQIGCGRSGANNPRPLNTEAWQQKMKNPSLTEAEFTELYAQALRGILKDAQVTVTDNLKLSIALPDGGKWDIRLGNLWAEAAANPGSRTDICQSHLKSILAMVQQKPGVTGPAQTNSVVPTIKDDVFLGQFAGDTSDRRMVAERLVADLNIVYATDRDGMIALLMESDRERFNLEFPALQNLAIANLKRVLHPIQQRNNGTIFMVTTDDGYTSSILLLDDFWKAQTNSVKGEIIAAVPARDILLFTDSDSADGLKQLKDIVQRIHASGNHAISTTLLRRRDEHWEKFTN